MKELSDLVCDFEMNNFNEVKEKLNFLDKRIDELRKRKTELEDETRCYDPTLTLHTMRSIYFGLLEKDDLESFNLALKILKDFPMIEEYDKIVNDLHSLITFRDSFLQRKINFNNLGELYCEHQFFIDDGNLRCAFCDVSTKDLGLSKEDVEVLVRFAKNQGCFIEYASLKDMPLIKVLYDEIEKIKAERTPLNLNDDAQEEYYLQDEALMTRLKTAVKIAHMRDGHVLDEDGYRLYDSKYLSDEKAQELLIDAQIRRWEIEFSNSRHKDLLFEECLTSEFEIRILNGYNIPSLLSEVKTEAELIALTKAYYNLMNSDFRINSGYFKDCWDALTYNFYTADETVNNKILEIKLKR